MSIAYVLSVPYFLFSLSMNKRKLSILALAIAFIFITNRTISAQEKLLDSFDDISGWKVIVSDGVELRISGAKGFVGKCMRMEFEFKAGAGYAIAQKQFAIELPENYKFTFYLRAEAPVNNFEFKLIDSAESVYWVKKLNYDYPRQWRKTTIKKRHISFAWGPAGGGTIKKVDRIEFVVSAGTGGKGSIYIDEFKIEPISESVVYEAKLKVSASSDVPGHGATMAIDKNLATKWKSKDGNWKQWFLIDFQKPTEFGGLVIDWDREHYAQQYDVLVSNEGKRWRTVYTVKRGNGGRNYIAIREGEAKLLKLDLKKSGVKKGYAINDIEIKPTDFSATANNFFEQIAQEVPKGYYPKYFCREQTYWTVVGTSGDTKEALINQEGTIEVDKSCFSLEPFLFVNNKLVTWNDVKLFQKLEKEYLPIPSVLWRYGDLELQVKVFSAGEAGKSALYAWYQIRNHSAEKTKVKLFIALRPFQVLPPWQNLNITGGATNIKTIRYESNTIRVDQNKVVFPLVEPTAFGCAEFDQHDITDYLKTGDVPEQSTVTDHVGYASGALEYEFDLAPEDVKDIYLVVPFHDVQHNDTAKMKGNAAKRFAQEKLKEIIAFWESKVSNIEIYLPPSASRIVNSFKSSIAYILVNRDGPAIQPGSRTYERAWIRDGSMTSAALLRTGNVQEVREYIDWYAKYQYPNGKIPCVVDSRGADPVPEHDSPGQFIYAVAEYYRFTGDPQFLKSKLPNVVNAVNYIEFLRNQRTTDTYKFGGNEQKACYGLVPESISHEGYSAKPMHSYWDDFFVMKGLKDAVMIARSLGETELEKRFEALRDEFKKSLYASMRLAMANRSINFIPGCVELGDFDATSTAIGIYPCGELGNIPEPQLTNTFDKYYEFFKKRLNGEVQWENYTPYEVRIIGAFIYLDERKHAHELLNFLFSDQRPATWNHWAEIVWRDEMNPKFIGDMPHTWIASDYINAVRSMFVYERESDSALVIGAGILEEWLDYEDGVMIKGFPTYYGNLDYTMKKRGADVVLRLAGNIKYGRIVIKSPRSKPVKGVSVDGRNISTFNEKEALVGKFPGEVILHY